VFPYIDAGLGYSEHMFDMNAATDILAPWAIRAAVTLRIPDLITDGCATTDEIAVRANVDPQYLARLVRYLVTIGVFDQSESGNLGLTKPAEVLLTTHPSGTHVWLNQDGASGRMDAGWSGLLHAVRTGKPAYDAVFGRSFDEDVAGDTVMAESWNELMAFGGEDIAPEVRQYAASVWQEAHHVVDIGGGTGALLIELLMAYPQLRGTLLEIPAAALKASENFSSVGLSHRTCCVSGSFFDAVPDGGDVYVLSCILHNWCDDSASDILRRCARTAGAGRRVVVVERVVEAGAVDEKRVAALDMHMMLLGGGRERSSSEYSDLLRDAGVNLVKSGRLPSGRMLFEGVIRSS
jgi:hypothetical protein